LRLKHGWVAVVNRGQADINKRVTMTEARSRELDFFKGTDSYRCGLVEVKEEQCREGLCCYLIVDPVVVTLKLFTVCLDYVDFSSAVCICCNIVALPVFDLVMAAGTLTTLAPSTWPTS